MGLELATNEIRMLPHSKHGLTLRLGESEDAVTLLLVKGGMLRRAVYAGSPAYVLEWVELEMNGVIVEAGRPRRDATLEEAALLQGERAHAWAGMSAGLEVLT